MMKNVGGWDRVLRIVVGLALIAWGFLGLEGSGRWIAVIVGLVPFLTGAIGFCPLYKPFHFSTHKG